MSVADKPATFEDVMAGAAKWATIDEIRDLCDNAEGFWSQEFIDSAATKSKNAKIRRLIKTLKDETGFPLHASVETTNEDGETIRVYKQELLFDPDDYRQVVTYHSDRASHHGRMARGYAKRSDERFKTELDRQLTIDFDDT